MLQNAPENVIQCLNVEDISNYYPVFSLVPGGLQCTVCDKGDCTEARFKFTSSGSRKAFSNLKQRLSVHLNSCHHQMNIENFGPGTFIIQYHKLKVIDEILSAANTPKTYNGFFSFTWDAAHLLELAASASRGQHVNPSTMTITWIKNTLNLCGDVSRKYKWGRNYSTLRRMYDEITCLDIRMNANEEATVQRAWTPKSLKQWSTTRFSAHLHVFLDSFLDNYTCLAHLAKEKDETLRSLNAVPFVLRLRFLIDLYKVIGETSKLLQFHDQFTWQVHTHIQNLLEIVNSMHCTLSGARDMWPANRQLVKFNNCVNELLANGSFRGEPVLDVHLEGNHECRFWNSIEESRKQFLICLHTFSVSLHQRLSDQLPEILSLLSPLFQLSLVFNRALDSVPEQLQNVYERFGQILFGDTPYYVIHCEYQMFQLFVQKFGGRVTDAREEVKFYMKLLNAKNDFPNISHLLATSCVRTYCESIVESTGSSAKQLLCGRESMKHTTFRNALFVKVNGPNIGDESQNLLEEVLRRKFGEYERWHFYRRSPKEKLVSFIRSKVVDRKNVCSGRLAS